MVIDLRAIQKPLASRYRQQPEEAIKRYRLRTNVDGADVFHSSATSHEGAGAGSRFAIAVDPKLGGPGQAPTPGDLLLAALATCQESSLRMVAAAMRIDLRAVEVEVTGEVDLRGAMMLAGEAPVGFRNIRCNTKLQVAEGTPPDAVERLRQFGEHCCVIGSTLRKPPAIESQFEVETV
ncbi:MAG TPA: OsmC family protein [Polyangia bacterium]|nr:OsmC family protein [Polyangia bacterium]